MKLIYLVTEDWYFLSHRLPMAQAALREGFDVAVITNVSEGRAAIEAAGVRVIPLSLERKSLNPFTALRQIAALTGIYRREKPDLVHHVAMKPMLYGSIAAAFAKVPHVLNAFAGLGVIFNTDIPLARVIRPVLVLAFRLLLKRPGFWTLFQNKDDQARMQRFGVIDPDRSVIIRGSGVDTARFTVAPLPPEQPFICIYAGRMIETKGLPTMREAFEILELKAPHIVLWMYGKPDEANPGSWDQATIHEWDLNHPTVKWKGHSDNMAEIWPQAHLALQPSWGGEGLPMAMLEAGACGRAMIVSDVPGCREVVEPGRNGFLVPAGDAEKLADAILEVASNMHRCAAMGQESRKIIEENFSAERISHETGALYRRIVSA